MRGFRAFWQRFREFNAANVWLWQRHLSSLRPWEHEQDVTTSRSSTPNGSTRGPERIERNATATLLG